MKELKIKNEYVELLNRLAKRGYIIEGGATTYPITRAVKKAGVNVFSGYDQDAKKMVLALERPINIKLKTRTRKKGFGSLKFSFFDVEE